MAWSCMKQIFATKLRIYLFGGIFLGFFTTCSIVDPAEDIPSYIHIDNITLSAIGNQGSSSAAITEAWIFMDGELVGGFELPCTVPILAAGNHSFIIKGGVKMNGLTSTRAIYPSWKGWEGTLELTRGEIVNVNPSITYFPLIDFVNTWMENFETAGISLIPETNSSAIVVKDSIPYAFEGNTSAYIHLNNNDTTNFVGSSSIAYNMPAANNTWIEFNYWSDTPFICGIVEENNPNNRVQWVSVNPNWAWGKIYIRLTDALASATQNVNYKIYFAMENPSSQTESNLYLDNIKLLK